MNNADIVYAHENFFKPNTSEYSPAEFHSLFDSFCTYLSQKSIGLDAALTDIDEKYDLFHISQQQSWFCTQKPLEFSVSEVFKDSPYLKKEISDYVLRYIKSHIWEYEPEILQNHIELLKYGLSRYEDFAPALQKTYSLYYDGIASWVENFDANYDRIYALSSLPVTDGNFTGSLKSATPNDLALALVRMNGKDGNKSRISACEKRLKHLTKEARERD